MSSPEASRRACLRLALAAALGLGLSGCLQPLYGPSASGLPVQDLLAAIEVAPVTAIDRRQAMTHYLRSELIYDLNGSGQPAPKRYKLEVTLSVSIANPIIDTTLGRASASTMLGTADYKLVAVEGGTVVTSGQVVGSASYERSPQRFAVVRAERDAEIRAAKLISEQIRNRLAIALRTRA